MVTFTQTCDKPYDQCVYAIIMKDGTVRGVWEDYEHARDTWLYAGGKGMCYIKVMTLDELKPTKTSGGGF